MGLLLVNTQATNSRCFERKGVFSSSCRTCPRTLHAKHSRVLIAAGLQDRQQPGGADSAGSGTATESRPSSNYASLQSVDIENLDRDYCDDFECTSSPAIETSIKAFSRDLRRMRFTMSLLSNDVEFSDGIRSFKGSQWYKRSSWVAENVKDASVRVLKIAMLDKGTAQLQWQLTGTMLGLPLDIAVTTVIQLQLLTARITLHRETWDTSRCSPLAAAAVAASKLLWSARQLAAASQQGLDRVADSLASMDEEGGEVYRNPSDPTRFFQQQDTRVPDFFALATLMAFLYFVFKAFEAIEQIK